MKVVKILFKIVLWTLVIVLLALLAMPLWFGPVGKTVANGVVPGVVKTDFHLGVLALNPYTARFEFGDLQLANPPGYSERYAVTLGDVVADAETLSLASDVIHIEEIRIKDVYVSYLNGGPEKVNNFLQIQYNVAGGKDKYEASQREKKVKPEAKSEEKSNKKVIIDRLEVSGLVVQYGVIPLRLPCDLVLKDIGRKSDGATLEEIWQQIWNEILKAAGAAGDQLKALGNAVGDLGKTTGDLGKETVKDLGKTAKDLGKTAKDLGKSLKAEEGVKAVGDSAKKALDSLKGLW